MKKYLAVLPLFLLLIATSCTETDTPSDPKVEKEEQKKPLLEREPEVREYLEVVDELVDEYLTLGENLLDDYEELESGDMDTFEKFEAIGELAQSVLEIEELTGEFNKLNDKKSKCEEKLDADDIIEFGLLFNDKMERFYELSERVKNTDFSSFTHLL
jgi:Mg2+ and Co2+ transporter CorA